MWIGYRLIEHLSLEAVDKQSLLELNSPLERLDRLAQYIHAVRQING